MSLKMRSYEHEEIHNKGSQPFQDVDENIESENEQNSSRSLIRISKVKELQARSKFGTNRSWRLLFQFYGLENRIPKQLITLDEKYIYRCIQMMHVSAVKAAAGNESAIISGKDVEIVGSITGSKSMMNILGSPLLKQFGDSDRNVSSDIGVEEDEGYGRRPMHERFISMSSSNSTFSDQSSSVSSNYTCHAMLHCTWKDGFPKYIFSIDDQRDVYAANLYKLVSPDDQGMDCVYTFHSSHECDSHIVGKMKVSTLVTPGQNNSEIAETRFILFGSDYNWPGEMITSTAPVVRNKTLRRKLSNVFRSDKRRTLSKFSGTSFILEETSWNPSDESYNNFDYIPNLELAAIIVKDHLPAKPKIGGWGLKFLRNSETSSTSPPPPSECSTSMDILVAAGFHGGPRTSNGGPSSIVERFRSGGQCDCGGWDIGCPLTVLSTGSKGTDISRQGDSFDLFVEGSKQSMPTIKMTNIHDGLYYIDFESVLSALQVFSIATAIIHSHSPSLKHKLYRNR